MQADGETHTPTLRDMLLGPPLTQRVNGSDPTLEQVDAYLEAVIELLPNVYGDTTPSRQAQMELRKFLDMGGDQDAAFCKRAALLFALAREKEVGNAMERCEGEEKEKGEEEEEGEKEEMEVEYVADMRDRVLPFLLPRFARNSCQAPDSFVTLACVLSEMWEGERLGNWPLVFGNESGGASAL